MNRFALNFICKNESPVILRMLESVKPMTDLIVAVDTGSTDDTIGLIRGFGEKNNIPTYVFERAFDDFGRSRNHALDKLRSTVEALEWDAASTWGFRMDCDEQIDISDRFTRTCVDSDLCSAPLQYRNYMNDAKTYRQLFFRLSRGFAWDGPIHEELECCGGAVTTSVVGEIRIIREAVGASWKGDQEQKCLKLIEMVREHIGNGHRTFKWFFHMGNTYIYAADYCKDATRRKGYFEEARHWFEETAATIEIENRHERYKLFQSLADTREQLGEEREEVREAYLKAYSMDKRHAEPLAAVIRSCIQSRHWQTAYLYSSFAVANFHRNRPSGLDIELVQDRLYEWELLLYHCTVCIYAGRIVEGKASLSTLGALLSHADVRLSQKDRMLIRGTVFRLSVVRLWRWLSPTGIRVGKA